MSRQKEGSFKFSHQQTRLLDLHIQQRSHRTFVQQAPVYHFSQIRCRPQFLKTGILCQHIPWLSFLISFFLPECGPLELLHHRKNIVFSSAFLLRPESSPRLAGSYKKLIKNVMERVFKKSANRLPTKGIRRYAFTEGSYFSQTTCIFAMAFGVAPIPNPQTPELMTAAS